MRAGTDSLMPAFREICRDIYTASVEVYRKDYTHRDNSINQSQQRKPEPAC